MSNVKQPLQRGFTVVELLVIAPIVILTIGAFITVIVNMTGEVLATRASGFLAYSVQDSLNRIEDDIKLSTTFLAETNITLTSPQGYGNSTMSFTNVDVTKGNMLILNALATIGNPYQSSNGLVYLTNLPNSCTSADVNQNKPMTYNIVYFVENSTLWRRTLMPPDYTTAGCNAPWQKPSCNPNQSGAFCVGKDIRLLDNVDVSQTRLPAIRAPPCRHEMQRCNLRHRLAFHLILMLLPRVERSTKVQRSVQQSQTLMHRSLV
jgi:hypothetical protein